MALLERSTCRPRVYDLYPHELSGGMKQRVCIAMAIALKPALIIADEPTSALDVVVQRTVAQTLLDVKKRIGSSMILIGHDMALQAQLVDRIAVMFAGNIVEIGSGARPLLRSATPYTRHLIASIPSIREAKPLLVHGRSTRRTFDPRGPHRPWSRSAPGHLVAACRPIRGRSHDAGRRRACLSRRRSLKPLLDLSDVTKVYGRPQGADHRACRASRLTLGKSPATITTIAGESGSGKTTLANVMLGSPRPRGPDPLPGPGPRRTLDRGDWLELPARGPGDLPGPVRGLQPVLPDPARLRRRDQAVRPRRRRRPMRADLIEDALEWSVCGRRGARKHPHQLSGGHGNGS